MLLAVAGGVLGLAIAYWSVKTLVATIPTIPRGNEVGIDGSVMALKPAIDTVTL